MRVLLLLLIIAMGDCFLHPGSSLTYTSKQRSLKEHNWPLKHHRRKGASAGLKMSQQEEGEIEENSTRTSFHRRRQTSKDQKSVSTYGILSHAQRLLAKIEKDASSYTMMKFNEDFLFKAPDSVPKGQ